MKTCYDPYQRCERCIYHAKQITKEEQQAMKEYLKMRKLAQLTKRKIE